MKIIWLGHSGFRLEIEQAVLREVLPKQERRA